jgi:hypothetical protein
MADDYVINFDAPPTISQMMMDNKKLRFTRGPVGSGKSTGKAMELFRRAIEQAPGPDGIRRTQMAVVRNTGQQLRTTCLVTIQTLFGPLVRWKPSTMEVIFEFDDIYSNWILLPLDTPDNIRRLLSLELTMAWVSEFREIQPQIVKDVFSRCGRYPSKLNGGPTFYGVVAETNAFDEDSLWFDELENELPGNWSYFVQPSGATIVDFDGVETLVPTGENHENLPETYYQDLAESNGGPESNWSRQYIFNEIAPSVSGEAVFNANFDHDFHISKTEIEVIPTLPLCIGIDTDRNPAAVVTQIDPIGRMNVLGEAFATNMGMELFVETYLRPLLYESRFAGCPVYLVIDPSGITKSSIGEESTLAALTRMGFVAILAQTNMIEPRLRAVDTWLQKQLGGKGAIQFDKTHCPVLVLAMGSRYRFRKKKKDQQLEVKPDKNHPFSDLCDGLQYACLGGSTAVRGRAIWMLNAPTHATFQEPSSAAWT